MMPEIFAADSYEAFQIGSEVVLIAQALRAPVGAVMFFEKNPGVASPSEYTLLCEELVNVRGQRETTAYPCIGFKAFQASEPLGAVRIHAKDGVRNVRVTHQPKGIEVAGGELDLPVISGSVPLEMAIGQMKAVDRRAVVVEYGFNQHELFMNYQIAHAYTGRATLTAMRGMGHRVATAQGKGAVPARMHLFSMEWPGGGNLGHVTTMFKSVGGSVASTGKVCLCTTRNRTHSCLDRVPTLDQTPCVKAPPGHGTYDCF